MNIAKGRLTKRDFRLSTEGDLAGMGLPVGARAMMGRTGAPLYPENLALGWRH